MRQRKRAHDATYRARVKSNPELRALYFAHIKRGVDKRRALKHGAAHEPYSRAEIFTRWGNTCAYCDAPAEHLDHVIALSRGGADAAHNLLPACAPCNLSKGARSLAEWVQSWGRSPDPT
jgi:5-methylcytosine-specific restriction endonuclease McrA